jgi:hypothetical protein
MKRAGKLKLRRASRCAKLIEFNSRKKIKQKMENPDNSFIYFDLTVTANPPGKLRAVPRPENNRETKDGVAELLRGHIKTAHSKKTRPHRQGRSSSKAKGGRKSLKCQICRCTLLKENLIKHLKKVHQQNQDFWQTPQGIKQKKLEKRKQAAFERRMFRGGLACGK